MKQLFAILVSTMIIMMALALSARSEEVTMTKREVVNLLSEGIRQIPSRDLASWLVGNASPEGDLEGQMFYSLLKTTVKLAKDMQKAKRFSTLTVAEQDLILSASPEFMNGLDATITIPPFVATDEITFIYSETDYAQSEGDIEADFYSDRWVLTDSGVLTDLSLFDQDKFDGEIVVERQ